MLATVRNRRALVSSVEPFDGRLDGRLHLVRLEYIDADGVPEDTIIWERELNARLLEPVALPNVAGEPPMPRADFAALQRATRWTAISPFLTAQDNAALALNTPIAAPFFGAVQVEDFQLLPLLKALRMPRVSLLLADDVGLGKTIEAGLIMTELLLRRRIQRVMILCPASLRKQWQQEMRDKFALHFDIIDRVETHALQKRLGLDANPWRTYPRIITSYYYLRQPDVLEQFRAACRQPEGTVHLPWDLLIVDEAHNLMPSNFGEDSDLSKMLRFISPWFEHKIFATATPHNGYTRCFSGLLEQLDPVRFTQTSEFTPGIRQRVEEVVIRRLKREINAQDEAAGHAPRFPERIPEPLPLYFGAKEKALSAAFQEFRRAVRRLTLQARRSEQLAGIFALEVLNKRLLSSPYTFANSWYRFKEGMAQVEQAEVAEVQAARRAVEEDLDDDREVEGRQLHAAKTTGAWLKPLATRLEDEIAGLDAALERIGLVPEHDDLPNPVEDARWERFLQLVKRRLRNGPQWVADERLIVFTEYKTTLDYLEQRLRETFPDDRGAIRVLFGGMTDYEREAIKAAFNDPTDPVRILVATDTASEGLNLQETARLVLHYDIPFNPARLDQRNGRLDRHGQARDVIAYHFTSEDDADLKFLAHVVEKVNTIREDLGSMGEVFDAAFERRFVDLADTDLVTRQLDDAVEHQRGRADIPRSSELHTGAEEKLLSWLADELDLHPETLQSTLEQALGMGIGLPRFEEADGRGRVRLRMPLPSRWEPLIDDHLRLETNPGQRGPLPALVFDPQHFIQLRNGRPVYRAAKDTTLLHLGHPLLQHALAMFARARFPGGVDQNTASRWAVSYGDVPAGADALLLLTIEELAVNDLRESFHHWVQTLRFPLKDGQLGQPLPHLPAAADHSSQARPVSPTDIIRVRAWWPELEFDLKEIMGGLARELTERLTQQLAAVGKEAQRAENARFTDRIKEVEKAKSETTLKNLEKEWATIQREKEQIESWPALFPEFQAAQQARLREIELQQGNIEDELRRRRSHYEELQLQLEQEKQRVLEHLLPRRYKLRDQAQVFPVMVEIRLRES
ncbi:MAG: DISARM system SNF2-like helicase DrmD [Anaerolineae bacterium]|nr:DISARM system SNF2-like helicase DrmD [Anaerolineae bacterium]